MRKSVGYGAYDGFGEDIPEKPLYNGATPIRFGRGSVEITAKGGEGPKHKKYVFEAGATPLGILIMVLGGGAFVFFAYKLTGTIFGG